MKDPRGRVGVIAGSGDLPLHIARSLSGSGRDVFVAGLKDAADARLKDPSWDTQWIDFFRLGDLLASLKEAGVSEVILAGHVDHRGIFRTEMFDDRMLSFLRGLRDRRGATLLSALVLLLTAEGYSVPSLIEVAPDLVPSEKFAAGPVPAGPGPVADLRLGWAMARRMADLDIGQTVAVKDGAVVAAEGMEGTDECVRRASLLAGDGLTVVKRAAAGHDFRFDVPTVGRRSIEVLSGSKGGTFAVEAGRCFILDREEVIFLCGRNGIALLACREDENGAVSWASR